MSAKDQNGKIVRRNVRKEADGTWGVNVWFGGAGSVATSLRRYFYRTREMAAAGDISDEPGRRGCVRIGEYLDA